MAYNKEQIPVIVVHKGNQKYLENCIRCAEKAGNTVILIGDEKNRTMCENWISCEDCESDLFGEFKKNYVHMSSNSEFFELICFQRYFYVYEYMRKRGLTQSVMIDSDGLVYREITAELIPAGTQMGSSWYEKQKPYQWTVCPHFTYWTQEGLADFVRFCVDSYRSGEGMKLLKEKYRYHTDNKQAGGICDMTLLYLWMKQTDMQVENFSARTDEVIDYNINEPRIGEVAYVMRQRYGMKQVLFLHSEAHGGARMPHFVRAEDNKSVPVIMIHAWGGSKKYMGVLKDGKESNLCYDWARGTAWVAKRWNQCMALLRRGK